MIPGLLGTTQLIRGLLRNRVRGSTRLTLLIARTHPRFRVASVRLPEGTVFVDLSETSSHGLFAGLPYEESEIALVRRSIHLGDVAVDVGAHWGLYTVVLASLVGPRGRVLAFEPCPVVLPCLRRTVAALPNTILYTVAAADAKAPASLAVPTDASMASFVDWTCAGARARRFGIESVRIDDLLRDWRGPSVCFMKCDVEGAEALVLKGATAVLNRPDAPVVMLEVNAKASAAIGLSATAALDVLGGLREANYGFYVQSSVGDLVPLAGSPERSWHVFAVPARRSQWLASHRT